MADIYLRLPDTLKARLERHVLQRKLGGEKITVAEVTRLAIEAYLDQAKREAAAPAGRGTKKSAKESAPPS